MTKLVDLVAFGLIGSCAYYFYLAYGLSGNILHALGFDAVMISAALYVMFRNRKDINIVSLIMVLLLLKPVNMAIMFSSSCSHGLAYYPLMILLNTYTMVMIWMRPVIFSNFGPLKKHKEGWKITKADDAMTIVLTLMVIFDVLLLIEQLLRYIWPTVMFFYDLYEIAQATFAVVMIAVFYFMAGSSRAREKSKIRAK